MSKQIILVTGGSGLVGNAINHIWKESAIYQNNNNTYSIVSISSKDYDLTSSQETKAMFEKYKPTHVIHLAACVGGLYKNMNQKIAMFENNLAINNNVIKYAYESGVKNMVACLSTCIFPDKPKTAEQCLIDETMLHDGPPHFSNDAYAYAKRMLEVQCRIYNESRGTNYICVIPTNIYGPYDNFHLEDAHVLPALIHKCFLAKQNNENFVVRGSGNPLRQFIYSHDLAKLILSILFISHEDSNSKMDPIGPIVLSVPEADEISIGNVARLIAKKFDYQDRMVFDSSFSDGQYKKTASNKKLMSFFPEFDFFPIENGISDTIDWFLENQDIVRK
jgi:GDP-L-fucose synthase